MHAFEMRMRLVRLCRRQCVECVCISGDQADRTLLAAFRDEIKEWNAVCYVADKEALQAADVIVTPFQLWTAWHVYDAQAGCAYLIDTDAKQHELIYLFVGTSPLTYMITTIKDELEHMIVDLADEKGRNKKKNWH